MHAIIWVSLKSTVLSERNLTQKCANCTTPFINILEQAKLIYSGKRSEQWLPLGVWAGPPSICLCCPEGSWGLLWG